MVKSGLTEKRMQDRRFQRTEKAILMAVFSIRNDISVSQVVKKACISRSTFYRHHKTAQSIVFDYEEYVLGQFKKTLRRWNKNQRVNIYFEQMLLFINKNKIIVEFLLENGGGKLIEKMVKELEPGIIKTYKIPKNHKMTFIVYQKEILGVIEDWEKTSFDEQEMSRVLNNVLYLTRTIRERLIMLDS